MERVGYYKISRSRFKRLFSLPHEERILIHHHWKSDLSTGSETELPEAWCLACNERMEPVWFGRFTYRTIRRGWLRLTVSEIEETWGPKPGTLHTHEVAARLTNQD